MISNFTERALQVDNVSKIYKLYDRPVDRLKESLHPFGKKFHKEFHALNDISLKIDKNETVGLIGKNGSGKSTLLKMITGLLSPTAGTITVNGKISALLELGAGFNPEYTGLENIYMNGTIMGYTREEMDRKMPEIVSFADIGDFINHPVKLYSSGMFVRLAFAVAINVDPEILIIDEALSVGDMRFQQKCFRKIEEFKREKTIIVVSHDMGAITNYCDRVIWINEGILMAEGEPLEIAKQYQAFMIDSSLTKGQNNSDATQEDSDNRNQYLVDRLPENLDVLGDNKVTIEGISMIDALTDQRLTVVSPNQEIKILVKTKAFHAIEDPIIGFTLKDRLGNTIGQTNSFALGHNLPALAPGDTDVYVFRIQLPALNRGQYTLSPAVASGSQQEHTQHCWIHDAIIFTVFRPDKHQLEGYFIFDKVDFYQIK
jgi:ABC-type polysaccharide/polyol phosphate transport system ATPase subunit